VGLLDSPHERKDVGGPCEALEQASSPLAAEQELVIDAPHQPTGIKFPKKQYGDRQRSFLETWFKAFPWLNYVPAGDDNNDSVTCYICQKAKRKNLFLPSQRLEATFIKAGFSNWKKCPKQFADHEKSLQHQAAAEALTCLKNDSVTSQLFTQIAANKQTNFSCLRAIFESAIFLCRQGLPFQGHCAQDGNFFQLLMLRSNDVPELRQWLLKRDNWLSHDVQKEVINDIGTNIQRRISTIVKNALFFSCLADGTVDITGKEQLAILFRVTHADFSVQDLFLGFYNINDSTGKSISSAIKDVSMRFDVNFGNCRGLGFDGAANMSGAFNGAQALIRKDFPAASYVHCGNHRLDLCLQEVGREEALICDALEIVRQVAIFIKESSNRLQKYDEICRDISMSDATNDFTQLACLCPTRWTVRVKSLKSILNNFQPLLKLLLHLSSDKSCSPDSRAKAAGFMRKLTKFTNIVGIHVSISIFTPCEKFATKLQNPANSIGSVYAGVTMLRGHISELRRESSFEEIFETAEAFRVQHDINLPTQSRKTRLPGWLDDRPDTAFQPRSDKENLKISYFRVMDRIYQALDRRFDDDFLKCCDQMETTLLSACGGKCPNDILNTGPTFGDVDTVELCRELKMLPTLVKQCGEKPILTFQDFVSLLKMSTHASLDFFPTTVKLTKLLLTLPATVASAERSFSTLRRLKTWLRSTTTQSRLTALAVCHTHKELLCDLDVAKLCHDFASRTDERRRCFL
jgi:hypothetical protein